MKKYLIFLLFSSFILSTNYACNQEKEVKKKENETMNTDFIHWYGQSSFRIEEGNLQIYIDPFKLPTGELPKADIILLTHGHFDHYSPDDIDKIRKNETAFVVTSDMEGKIKGNVKIIKPDTSLDIGKIKINTIPAYNLDKHFHPKGNSWVGYIITLSNGLKIYHAGDTDTIPEMRALKVDIALLPIGGTYTMTASEAAGMVNIFQPTIAIPMHYGDIVGSDKDAEIFKKESKITVVIKTREK
jgi:L-ascorbate metabolism protein UlaG (beta-lactamase superfamily)